MSKEMTLDEAVAEVLNFLTGLDLHYIPELDRYRSVTRALNRALRQVTLEHEWSYYSDTFNAGVARGGAQHVTLPQTLRVRGIGDDAVRLKGPNGDVVQWAYLLPRDALHKYRNEPGLWASVTRDLLSFSRPLLDCWEGLTIEIPVMREPNELIMPEPRENIEELGPPKFMQPWVTQVRNFHNPEVVEEWVTVPGENPVPWDTVEGGLDKLAGDTSYVRSQKIDFDFPDLIVARAAYLYAQGDPLMQPRVQSLEAQYKDLMYQLVERDKAITDTPYSNEWQLPIMGDPYSGHGGPHNHPHADWKM